MEAKIEDFNWNLRLFQDVLSNYQVAVNKANPTTFQLLEKTLDTIEDLIKNADEIALTKNDAIMCNLNADIFEIKRTIRCHICNVDFAASRIDYLLHLADAEHSSKMIQRESNGVAHDSNNNNRGKDVSIAQKIAQKYPEKVEQSVSLITMLEHFRANQAAAAVNHTDIPARTAGVIESNENQDIKNGNDAQVTGSADVGSDKANSQQFIGSQEIPNVFDDNIYDFIATRGKSNADLSQQVNEPSIANKASKVNNTKYDFNQANPIVRQQMSDINPWHDKLSAPSTSVEDWRNPIAQSIKAIIDRTAAPSRTATAPQPTNIQPIARPTPEWNTKAIIQNGAILTGIGIKKCPTYELNNLYLKFPHLNPEKVQNPLKPEPVKELQHPSKSNSTENASISSRLQELFEKINIMNQATHSKEVQSNVGLKKSELTNSLLSLPAFGKSNATANQTKHRMPGRSASSLNLNGIQRMEGANPQKGNRKSPPASQHNGNSKAQANGQSRNNGQTKFTPNDPKSKGAIPKQSVKSPAQAPASNSQKVASDNRTKTNTNTTQNKDVKNFEPAKPTKKAGELKSNETSSMETTVNSEKLIKLFVGELSVLINVLISFSSRPAYVSNQKKVIQLVENTLKGKFNSIKCYLIGSHSYNIVTAGLSPMDIYIDLYDTFHTDRSGATFINGMTEVQKLLDQSDDWTGANCSAISRYAILSATNKATNLKCNFTFGTGVSVRNSDVITSLFDAQPVARQVVISIRLALKEGAIGGWVQNFTGYVVTLLVIFYFQISGKLPSVLTMQTNSNEIEKCGENMVNFTKAKDLPNKLPICKDRIRDLLIGFFDYYEKFDFSNKIISPFEGREINQNFRSCHSDSLSRSMKRFKSFIEQEPHRWTNNQMCIQDIFEHKRNVGWAITGKDIKAFKFLCGYALTAIRNAGPYVKY